MAYISNFTPEHLKGFNPVFLDAKENEKFQNEKRKKELQKIEENKIQFRDAGSVQLNKKPCPCMANKVKQTPSS